MRMLKPSPGEIADRQTILALKIKAGGAGSEPENIKMADESGVLERADGTEVAASRVLISGTSKVNIKPFVEENELLQQYLEKNWFPALNRGRGVEYDELFDQLGDVNERLWNLEDEARELKRTFKAGVDNFGSLDERARTVLFAITTENDKRSGLVQQISELFGITMQEKIYA